MKKMAMYHQMQGLPYRRHCVCLEHIRKAKNSVHRCIISSSMCIYIYIPYIYIYRIYIYIRITLIAHLETEMHPVARRMQLETAIVNTFIPSDHILLGCYVSNCFSTRQCPARAGAEVSKKRHGLQEFMVSWKEVNRNEMKCMKCMN